MCSLTSGLAILLHWSVHLFSYQGRTVAVTVALTTAHGASRFVLPRQCFGSSVIPYRLPLFSIPVRHATGTDVVKACVFRLDSGFRSVPPKGSEAT